MNAAHTPGPWTNHGRITQPGIPHSAVAAKTLIARVYSEAYGDVAQEMSNARLIAAAPDLLKALQEAEAALEVAMNRLQNAKPADWAFHATSEHLGLQIVRAAIAKATGAAS